MLYTYNEYVELVGSEYRLKKAVMNHKVYKIKEGIYATEKYVPELAVISIKYPKAIFTMNSAFYFHGLTDMIPEYYM